MDPFDPSEDTLSRVFTKKKRRSSILKIPEPIDRGVLEDINPNLPQSPMRKGPKYSEASSRRVSRRVSFSSSHQVKEFQTGAQTLTIWNNTYEEEHNNSSKVDKSNHGDDSALSKTTVVPSDMEMTCQIPRTPGTEDGSPEPPAKMPRMNDLDQTFMLSDDLADDSTSTPDDGPNMLQKTTYGCSDMEMTIQVRTPKGNPVPPTEKFNTNDFLSSLQDFCGKKGDETVYEDGMEITCKVSLHRKVTEKKTVQSDEPTPTPSASEIVHPKQSEDQGMELTCKIPTNLITEKENIESGTQSLLATDAQESEKLSTSDFLSQLKQTARVPNNEEDGMEMTCKVPAKRDLEIEATDGYVQGHNIPVRSQLKQTARVPNSEDDGMEMTCKVPAKRDLETEATDGYVQGPNILVRSETRDNTEGMELTCQVSNIRKPAAELENPSQDLQESEITMNETKMLGEGMEMTCQVSNISKPTAELNFKESEKTMNETKMLGEGMDMTNVQQSAEETEEMNVPDASSNETSDSNVSVHDQSGIQDNSSTPSINESKGNTEEFESSCKVNCKIPTNLITDKENVGSVTKSLLPTDNQESEKSSTSDFFSLLKQQTARVPNSEDDGTEMTCKVPDKRDLETDATDVCVPGTNIHVRSETRDNAEGMELTCQVSNIGKPTAELEHLSQDLQESEKPMNETKMLGEGMDMTNVAQYGGETDEMNVPDASSNDISDSNVSVHDQSGTQQDNSLTTSIKESKANTEEMESSFKVKRLSEPTFESQNSCENLQNFEGSMNETDKEEIVEGMEMTCQVSNIRKPAAELEHLSQDLQESEKPMNETKILGEGMDMTNVAQSVEETEEMNVPDESANDISVSNVSLHHQSSTLDNSLTPSSKESKGNTEEIESSCKGQRLSGSTFESQSPCENFQNSEGSTNETEEMVIEVKNVPQKTEETPGKVGLPEVPPTKKLECSVPVHKHVPAPEVISIFEYLNRKLKSRLEANENPFPLGVWDQMIDEIEENRQVIFRMWCRSLDLVIKIGHPLNDKALPKENLVLKHWTIRDIHFDSRLLRAKGSHQVGRFTHRYLLQTLTPDVLLEECPNTFSLQSALMDSPDSWMEILHTFGNFSKQLYDADLDHHPFHCGDNLTITCGFLSRRMPTGKKFHFLVKVDFSHGTREAMRNGVSVEVKFGEVKPEAIIKLKDSANAGIDFVPSLIGLIDRQIAKIEERARARSM